MAFVQDISSLKVMFVTEPGYLRRSSDRAYAVVIVSQSAAIEELKHSGDHPMVIVVKLCDLLLRPLWDICINMRFEFLERDIEED